MPSDATVDVLLDGNRLFTARDVDTSVRLDGFQNINVGMHTLTASLFPRGSRELITEHSIQFSKVEDSICA